MIAINHALTGALIGLNIENPAIALPVSLLSHFAGDAIPHYGRGGNADAHIQSKSFALQLGADVLLCFLLVLTLALTHPRHWLQAAICAFLATSPDFAWLPGYIRSNRGGHFEKSKRGWFMQFASRIQWFERPIGAYIEAVWFAGAITLLVAYL